jgi:hypothetical protein
MTPATRWRLVRCSIGCVAASIAIAVPAAAQTSATAPPTHGYVEAAAHSAFGNVTSQSYGGEFGWTTFTRNLQVFVEVGRVKNVATDSVGQAAQIVAAELANLQPAPVSVSVREPAAFAASGIRYLFPVDSPKLRPYVLAGAGVAKLRKDVAFELGGTAESIAQYVTLGSDLSGSETKPIASLGAGVVWPVYRRLIVDFQFRYGRIFADGGGVSVGRAGVGVGIAF